MENGRGFLGNYFESRKAKKKWQRGRIPVVHGVEEDGYSMMLETDAEHMAADPNAAPMSYRNVDGHVIRARTVGEERIITSSATSSNNKPKRRLW